MVLALIFAIDQTTINVVGGRKCWPIYLTLGNIPKKARRLHHLHSSVFIGYMPILNLEKHSTTVATRRRLKLDLYSECWKSIIESLGAKVLGGDAIVFRDPSGKYYSGYPRVAAFAVDYAEQAQLTTLKWMSCPHCFQERESWGVPGAVITHLRKYVDMKDAFEQGRAQDYELQDRYNVFWSLKTVVDIYDIFPLDPLHQLQKGVFEHLRNWLECYWRDEYGDAKAIKMMGEFNRRYISLLLASCLHVDLSKVSYSDSFSY